MRKIVRGMRMGGENALISSRDLDFYLFLIKIIIPNK
jgi:hypothetical protein